MYAAKSVKALLAVKASALVARDAQALDQMIDAGFMYVNSRGNKFGKEEFIATYCRSGLIVFHEQKVEDVEVIDHGDFAIASMTIKDRFAYDGVLTDGRYRSLGVFRKVGDRWLWAAGQTSSIGFLSRS
jgi:ketosteroid isomerase-like protein